MIIADAHILPNHCGRCSICDLAKYTVSLFGRNSCLLYTISVVCHINLTNGWMTVLLPCQIDTRQAAILMVGGLQVLYVIVGQKPLVCWRKLNNIIILKGSQEIEFKIFLFGTISSNSMSFQYMLYLHLLHLLESRHTNIHVPVPLSQKHVFPQPRSLQRCLTLVHTFSHLFCGN